MEVDFEGEHHRAHHVHGAQDVRVPGMHTPASFVSTYRGEGEHHRAQRVHGAQDVRVPGMHTPVSLVSTYRDPTNPTEMLSEENEGYVGEDMDCDADGDDMDGDYEDGYDDYIEGDGLDDRTGFETVDGTNSEANRKFRSKVWEEFVKIRVAGVVVKGQCKHCEAQITARRGVGTSAMRTHLRRCKVRRSARNIVRQFNATIMSPQGVALKDWRFNQEASRRELLRMIVLHELPLSIVEYEGFRRFVSSLNPVFKMVSRRTITLDCVASFQEHKQILQEALKNMKSRVSLTMDMWTSNQTLGYMCITCHCIDDDWCMHKRILKFSFVKTPHTGMSLFNVVIKALQDWNIEDKIFAITLDNASNNNAMLRLLKRNLLEKEKLVGKGKLLHQRCAAHVLNLICHAGLQSLSTVVHKIRESVKYVQGSPSRKQKFEEIIQQLGMSCKQRPTIDVSTRWNSTYLMVECAMELKRAFGSLKSQDSEYTYAPTDEEWEQARVMCILLKHFFDATNVLSVPVIFDPRFKLPFIEFRLSQAFGRDAASKIGKVKRVLRELFHDYSQQNVGSEEATQPVVQEEVTEASGRYADWDSYMSMNAHTANVVSSELETYLAKAPIPRGGNFDILAWWKSNTPEFPILSRVAKDVLVVPASTVASESAFSTGGRVISDSRSRLTPETVEALICLQDWMRVPRSLESHEAVHDIVEQLDQRD